MRVVVAVALTIAISGCGGSTPCQVTTPGGRLPEGIGDVDYGNGSLAIQLWPQGRLVAGRLPDGGSYAEIGRDGAVVAKLAWWRGAAGRLLIEGKRLDDSAPPLIAGVPDGYGPNGFQPTTLTFPTEGCWEVTGSVGRSRLPFVVQVSKS